MTAMILETRRTRIREMSPSDLDFIAAMLADPEVMAHYPAPLSRDEAKEWIARQMRRYRADGHGLWLVEEKASGIPLGQAGLIMQEVEGESLPEIGYLIHAPHWRKGYATETALRVREYAFGIPAFKKVISLIRPENIPSQGVAKKLGMTMEKEIEFCGRQTLVYAINKDKT